jgi:DNA-binding NarL/FixJ family response regulator
VAGGSLDKTLAERPAGVLIVDDDKILCELLRDRLEDEPGLTCTGIATTPDDARRLAAERRPAVVLVDVRMGLGIDAIALAADLVASSPLSQVLIWTGWIDATPDRTEELRLKLRAYRVGATDWIAKGEGINHLIARVHAAVRRGPASPEDNAPRNPIELALAEVLSRQAPAIDDVPVPGRHSTLTPAERRVAVTVARGLEAGMTIETIARTTSSNAGTLRSQLKHVYEKWGVHGQAEFVAEARRQGLI